MTMDRRTYILPDDSSHAGMAFRPNSTSDRDEWLKTFPNPMPATHYLHWGWNELGELYFECRPRPEAVAAGTEAKGKALPAPAGTNDRRKSLEAMSQADLVTKAAEIGAPVKAGSSKAALVAAIIAREDQRAKVATPAPAANPPAAHPTSQAVPTVPTGGSAKNPNPNPHPIATHSASSFVPAADKSSKS